MAKVIKAGILGASGYTGGDLVRLLVRHPNVEISFMTADRHAGKQIADLDGGVVGQVDRVEAVVGRKDVDDQQHVGRLRLHGDAELLHRLREPGQRLGHAVLRVHLGDVRIGADVERDA